MTNMNKIGTEVFGVSRVATDTAPASVAALRAVPRHDSPGAAYENMPEGWHIVELASDPGRFLRVAHGELVALANNEADFRHWMLTCHRVGCWRFEATPFGSAPRADPVYF